jgi:hypothetical protein
VSIPHPHPHPHPHIGQALRHVLERERYAHGREEPVSELLHGSEHAAQVARAIWCIDGDDSSHLPVITWSRDRWRPWRKLYWLRCFECDMRDGPYTERMCRIMQEMQERWQA